MSSDRRLHGEGSLDKRTASLQLGTEKEMLSPLESIVLGWMSTHVLRIQEAFPRLHLRQDIQPLSAVIPSYSKGGSYQEPLKRLVTPNARTYRPSSRESPEGAGGWTLLCALAKRRVERDMDVTPQILSPVGKQGEKQGLI